MEATTRLNKVCQELGVCPTELKEAPIIEAPGVKHARLMHQDNGLAVLTAVYSDGVITSCSGKIKDGKFESDECYSSETGQEGSYFPWLAHLAAVGYKEQHIEVGEKPSSPPIIERITAGVDVR